MSTNPDWRGYAQRRDRYGNTSVSFRVAGGKFHRNADDTLFQRLERRLTCISGTHPAAIMSIGSNFPDNLLNRWNAAMPFGRAACRNRWCWVVKGLSTERRLE